MKEAALSLTSGCHFWWLCSVDVSQVIRTETMVDTLQICSQYLYPPPSPHPCPPPLHSPHPHLSPPPPPILTSHTLPPLFSPPIPPPNTVPGEVSVCSTPCPRLMLVSSLTRPDADRHRDAAVWGLHFSPWQLPEVE